MGISEPIFLDFRDSGMDGTPENEHPAAFMNADADEVAGKLVRIIREVQPEVVVTFDETGGYGHPDHIAAWRHTHAAVGAAADPMRFPDAGEAWQVGRIAYGVFPRSVFIRMRDKLVELGEDTSELDRFLDLGIGFPDDQIHAVIDVTAFVDQKLAAIGCHKTQFGGDNFFSRIGDDEMRRMMSREYFSFGWPEPDTSTSSDSLFP
jgi:LmbE family N-acetylglucosaminyl deacetylase